jgi:nucleotide-binding universal stress UspA family protein
MYRLIQVPLDGSSFAENALPLAVSLAQRDGAALQVVRVHEPIAGIYLNRPEPFMANLDRELMDDVRGYLDTTISSVAGKTGLRPDSVMLKGPVVETIAQHATASRADLVIMTTQARGSLGRLWFGSIADALVRQLSIPILFVRPQEQAPYLGEQPAVRHVLVPLDGSELAEQALEPALALGGHASGEFTLLRVNPVVSPVEYKPTIGRVGGLRTSLLLQLDELRRQQEAEANDNLQQLAERLRARSINVRTQVVAHEQPAIAILDAAASLGVDAIATTTRGRSGIKRLLLGSIADKVIRGASIPVLVCTSEVASERSST